MVENCTTMYQEIYEDTPLVVTTAIGSKRLLGETLPYKYVIAYEIRVRSMGTATYIGIGTEQSQDVHLLAADQRLRFECNRYQVIDMTKKFVSCDTADATIEVMMKLIPFKLYGKVNKL